MDQTRLFVAIVVSIAILLGWQLIATRYLPHPPEPTKQSEQAPKAKSATPAEGGPQAGAPASPAAPPALAQNAPRLKIAAPSVRGSLDLQGARLDDLILNHYRETTAPDSPDVQLLAPLSNAHPYFVQFGWSAASGSNVKLPGDDTIWTASAPELTADHPVTLSWNNGAGLDFHILLSIDDNYMFSVKQEVTNRTGAPVELYPWQRIRRDYTPETSGYYILFEGLTGVSDGTQHFYGYPKTREDAKDKPGDVAYAATGTGGWSGITDKYWLTGLIPDQSTESTVQYRYIPGGAGHYQVDYVTPAPQTIASGATATNATLVFTGAKVVNILQDYQNEYHIVRFVDAVDWGWFYFLTKPIFYCLDFLNGLLGNFGLAIIVFTVFVKILFFPLANYSYRSMSKMRLLSPKITALRERMKDDPAKLQQEMMALYKAEKINPASGCLPMIVQIPVFFSLYKDIFVTIEMRQAPFYGWIHDLSQIDPTNVFNLFGLLPFDPSTISPFLHVGAWPLIMGFSMWLQQRLNPPPPDPTQAKLFQFMPVIFTFMLARFPAGLVIYWTTNNLLSVLQQWVIMRRTRLSRPSLARTT
jgi:YidC/Oxa1 family membrane protein insertase